MTTYKIKYFDNCHDFLKISHIHEYAIKEYIPILINIMESIPKLNICIDTPLNKYNELIVCDQHACIMTHKNDKYPVLATYALNACVGLILYSDKYKICTLAHIDGLPGYSKISAIRDGINISFDPVRKNIEFMLNYIRKISNTHDVLEIDFYLIGGIFGMSEIMIHDIIFALESLKKKGFIFIFKARNLLGPENQSRNICFDSRNGKFSFFDLDNNKNFNKNKNFTHAKRESEAILDFVYIAN